MLQLASGSRAERTEVNWLELELARLELEKLELESSQKSSRLASFTSRLDSPATPSLHHLTLSTRWGSLWEVVTVIRAGMLGGGGGRDPLTLVEFRVGGRSVMRGAYVSNIRPALQADLQAAESPKLNRKGSKRLTWLKLRWKTSEQEECPVCLEQLMRPPLPKTLMQLGCGHKFHTNCLVRWLESKPHCPCCRMEIAS
ncbi:E3 ubiquitin-protein ligase SIRP1 [Sesamum angolense]|uniref:E3 ubiquitin-protein ligase SIRP1 n=1 Tax=Sesamum angolense TaxID=2727404 RepID=A0AAE1T9S1_9LAMI|nr:E3 ubiquitin-protein ligase SIRP1 [Sesamum angolense]